MAPLLSAFCDGELGGERETMLREHLRACGSCRATLRAYRAAPRAVGALAPGLALERSLLERVHDAFAGLAARFGGGAGGGAADTALPQIAAGGGGGVAALAKVVAVCVGTAGGAAACVATGVLPAPAPVGGERAKAPSLERPFEPRVLAESESGAAPEAEPEAPAPASPTSSPQSSPADLGQATEPAVAPEPTAAGAVEYVPPPEPEPDRRPLRLRRLRHPARPAPRSAAPPGSSARERRTPIAGARGARLACSGDRGNGLLPSGAALPDRPEG